jgi:hypothetical protein
VIKKRFPIKNRVSPQRVERFHEKSLQAPCTKLCFETAVAFYQHNLGFTQIKASVTTIPKDTCTLKN